MRRALICLIFIFLLSGCSKTGLLDPETVCSKPGKLSWIKEKEKAFAGCSCKAEFRTGFYNEIQVIEIRILDPLCTSVTTVYKLDGTILLSSGDASAYAAYVDTVIDSHVFWNCTDPIE